ncbi:hypothetical protein [Aeromicrobium sp. HA]|uniref:hypothetical protein n=1 Tax=Aeromicrobium sp. HA TaxID=3009077 RepID=UPI0022AFDE71|nr:hypothetical protein [Aeromicrobium sp. HA]
MIELAARGRKLPAPPRVVWRSLAEPHQPCARPWLRLLDDEVEPSVVRSVEDQSLVWSSLWPSRPRDEVRLDVADAGNGETLLTFRLLTPDEAPDESKLGHLRFRLNHLFFADLRFSHGQ